MKKLKASDIPGGVWSAAPTPFTEKMEVDEDSIARMVEHHERMGVKGLFLAGTNGEGPWMTDCQRQAAIRAFARYGRGQFPLAVQVSDNSAARVLENIDRAARAGADIAIMAPPYFLLNAKPKIVLMLYREVLRRSPLPVGIYDRGKFSSVAVPEGILKELYADRRVVMIKDSSTSPERMRIALAAKKARPDLKLLSGWEFNCIPYLKAGYDGLLLGGGVFNGRMANAIMQAVETGDLKQAESLQRRMNALMYAVYGGKKIACWLGGEKQLLVELGIFSTNRNYLGYEATPACIRAIQRTIKANREWLLPPGPDQRGNLCPKK